MMNVAVVRFRALRVVIAVSLLAGTFTLVGAIRGVWATNPDITVKKLSWDVIGLDSNRPQKSSPDTFPVAAQFCNGGTTSIGTVQSRLTLGTGGSDATTTILADGATTQTLTSTLGANGSCVEAYHHVSIKRASASFGLSRSYTLDLLDSNNTVLASRTGTLYVEKLISQNRNSVTAITSSACSGTTCTFGLNQTYTITLWSKSSPNGYPQSEAFLDIPASLLQVQSIKTYFSVPSGYSTAGMYGDGCGFNQSTRACENTSVNPGLTGLKAGGNPIRTVYTVKAIATGSDTPGTTASVSTGGLRGLIYDFSGSSYHYNGDDTDNTKAMSVSVVPTVDLKVTKSRVGTSSEGAMTQNTASTYTIKIQNNSTNDLTTGTSTITDTLPSGFQLTGITVGASPANWSCSPTTGTAVTVTCTRAWSSTNKFVAGATHTITMAVKPTTAGGFTNTATVTHSAEYKDSDSTNDSSSDDTVVASSITQYDLAVSQSLSTTTFSSPGSGTYTIVVRNNGPASAPASVASPIRLTDTLPSGLTLTGAITPPTGWTCPTNTTGSSSLVCETTSAMAMNASTTFTVPVSVASNASSAWVTNTVTAFATGDTGNANDAYVTNNTSTLRTGVGSADLEIHKSHTGTFTTGSAGSFTIAVTNNGSSSSTGIRVVDTLPTGLTYSSYSSSDGFTCSTSGQTVTCTRATALASGATASISLSASASTAADYTNSVTVDTAASGSTNGVPNGTYDPVSTNNSDTDIVTVVASTDLQASKTATATVTAGSSISYTVTVKNAGSVSATNVYFADTMPFNVGLPSSVSFSATGFSLSSSVTYANSCGQSSRELDCTLGTIPAGGIVTATFTGTTTTATSNPAVNYVTAYMDQNDTSSGNETNQSASTTVTSGTAYADLSVSKALGSGQALRQGQTARYDVVVTNNGPSSATGVTVTDTLPSGLTYASSSGTNWSCNSGTMVCTLSGSLASGASTTLGVTVNVSSSASGLKTNTAVVSSTSSDPDSTNNSSSDTSTVSSVADLDVTNALDTGQTLVPGSNTVYKVVVHNGGPSSASSVALAYTLPTGLTYGSVSATGWTCSGTSSVSCTYSGTLSSGASSTLLLTIAASNSASGSLTTTAVVSASEYDPVASNNTATATASARSLTDADLSMTKAVSAGSALKPGQSASYDIKVSNAGPAAATNIVVTDTLPATLTYSSVSGTGWSCTPDGVAPNGSPVVCNVASLASGASSTMTITVSVDPGAPATLTNSATVSADQSDPDSSNNTATSTDPVGGNADLKVTKSIASPSKLRQGQQATYNIVVANLSATTAASGVSVSDTLPVQLTYVSASGTGWTCSGTTTVTCTYGGTLAASGSATINVVVTVGSSVAAGTSVGNTATVTAGTDDPDPTNNSATDTTTVDAVAALSITKALGTGQTLRQGQNATYDIVVTNAGPSVASGVALSDTLPSGLSYVSVSGTGWACTPGTPLVCNLTGTIAVSATSTASVTVSVSNSASGTKVNTVTVTAAEFDPDTSNNTATSSNGIGTTADVSVTKALATGQSLQQGHQTTYDVVISNAGPGDATGVAIADTLPSGLTFVSQTGVGWDCTNGTPVRCTLSTTLTSGTSSTVKITVAVDGAASGSKINAVTVSANEFDPDSSNNSATATSTVGSVADLSVTKALAPGQTLNAGADSTYRITVANVGPSAATSVSLADSLPSDMTFKSASSGWSCSGSSPLVCTYSGTIAAGTSATLDMTVKLSATASGNKTNTVTASSAQNDPDTSDNTATSTDRVSGVNGAPSITIVIECAAQATPTVFSACTSPAPLTNDLVRARIVTSQDPENDALTYDYKWWVNGIVLRSTLATTSLTDVYDLSPDGKGDVANLVSVVVTPSDGNNRGLSAEASVQVGNSTPTALDRSVYAAANPSSTTFTLLGSDPDNQTLKFRVTSLPASGTLKDSGTPITSGSLPYQIPTFGNTLTYTPAGSSGTVTFGYQVGDTQGAKTTWSDNTATVTITTGTVNQATTTGAPTTSSGRDTVTATPNSPNPTSSTPVKTSIQATAPAGTTFVIAVDNTPATRSVTPPSGYAVLPMQQVVTVRDNLGNDVDSTLAGFDQPLTLTFTVHSSLVPTSVTASQVNVYRDGVVVADCPIAGPGACVQSRTRDGSGNVVIVVLADHASDWNFAAPLATSTSVLSGPEGVTNAGSPNNVNGGSVTFTFRSTVTPAQYLCQLRRSSDGVAVDPGPPATSTTTNDCNAWTGAPGIISGTGTRTYDVSSLPDDLYTFRVQSVDGGNIARRDFVIDRTAPNVSINSGPTGTITVPTATFTFSSNEPGSTYDCEIDSDPFVACSSLTKTYSGLVNGTHLFTVRATDAASNASAAARSFTVAVTYLGDVPRPGGGGTGGGTGGGGGTPTSGLSRWAGGTRRSTAVAVSQRLFPNGADVVYIARDDLFPDALTGGPQAAYDKAPILLTPPTRLESETIAEIQRLHPKKIVIVGGTAAVSSSVQSQLAGLAATIGRLPGRDRYETAALVSKAHYPDGNVDTVVLATGFDFPDALAGGAAAYKIDGPVLLTPGQSLIDTTRQELARLRPKRVIVLGGTAAVSDQVLASVTAATNASVVRVAGANRYETAVALSVKIFRPPLTTAFVATGEDFPDALAAVPAAAFAGSPLLLTESSRLVPVADTELRRLQPTDLVLLGGTAAVSSAVEPTMLAIVNTNQQSARG